MERVPVTGMILYYNQPAENIFWDPRFRIRYIIFRCIGEDSATFPHSGGDQSTVKEKKVKFIFSEDWSPVLNVWDYFLTFSDHIGGFGECFEGMIPNYSDWPSPAGPHSLHLLTLQLSQKEHFTRNVRQAVQKAGKYFAIWVFLLSFAV